VLAVTVAPKASGEVAPASTVDIQDRGRIGLRLLGMLRIGWLRRFVDTRIALREIGRS
jgi:hypothetical protein